MERHERSALATPKAVLLDALGTLVELEPPWPRLIDTLRARRGIEVEWNDAREAMLAEMTYYKEHHDEGRDAESLAALRARCAGVIRERLPQVAELSERELTELLLDSLRFAPYPDVPGTLATLRGMGLRLAVVSNWDCSLRSILAEIGLAGLVDAVVVSAEVGARKPAVKIFEAALEAVDADPGAALFVGDSPETDVAGAEGAGIPALLLDRRGKSSDKERMHTIYSLADVPPLLGKRLL